MVRSHLAQGLRWLRQQISPQTPLTIQDTTVLAEEFKLVEEGPQWLLTFEHDIVKTGGVFHIGEEPECILTSTHTLGASRVTASVLRHRSQRVVIEGHGVMYEHSALGTGVLDGS